MNVPRAASLLLFLDKLGKRGGGRNSLLHLYIMFFSFNTIDFFFFIFDTNVLWKGGIIYRLLFWIRIKSLERIMVKRQFVILYENS